MQLFLGGGAQEEKSRMFKGEAGIFTIMKKGRGRKSRSKTAFILNKIPGGKELFS